MCAQQMNVNDAADDVFFVDIKMKMNEQKAWCDMNAHFIPFTVYYFIFIMTHLCHWNLTSQISYFN